jgi:hypothetical protein
MGEARVDLNGHPAVDAVRGVVDRPEHVAGATHIGHSEQPQHFSGADSTLSEFSDLIGVVVAAADGVREDRRIGRDPDDVAVVNKPVQRAGGEQLPA